MWKVLVNADLLKLPKYLFFLVLLFYPFFAFISSKTMGAGMTVSKAFGLICLGYLLFRLFEIYKKGLNLVIPSYVILFGLFTGYTLFCAMFVTDYFAERGSKYFYSDSIWLTFVALIIVENVNFSNNLLRLAKKVLWVTLILAGIVSLIQISNPLFFTNDDLLIKGLSVDRMAEYYKNNSVDSKQVVGYASRFLDGYRLSIFSYINGIAVGIDTIALFSILIAWKPINQVNRGVVSVFAAMVSFLSSSRWIILGFLIVASQTFWIGKNKLKRFFYFMTLSALLILILGFTASLLGFDVNEYVTDRLMSDSASTRLLAFEVFFEVFPDNPIFGTGGEDTEEMLRLLGGRSSQIHVGFLKLFYYYGIVGGILYLSFMVVFLVRLYKMAKSSGYWGGFFAILAFFIANLTLYELSLFYFGPLLAIIFANHFYSSKVEGKTIVKSHSKTEHETIN